MAKTPEGKAISACNAYKHGAKSAETRAISSWLRGLRVLTRQMQHYAYATGRGEKKNDGVSCKEKVDE